MKSLFSRLPLPDILHFSISSSDNLNSYCFHLSDSHHVHSCVSSTMNWAAYGLGVNSSVPVWVVLGADLIGEFKHLYTDQRLINTESVPREGAGLWDTIKISFRSFHVQITILLFTSCISGKRGLCCFVGLLWGTVCGLTCKVFFSTSDLSYPHLFRVAEGALLLSQSYSVLCHMCYPPCLFVLLPCTFPACVHAVWRNIRRQPNYEKQCFVA